MRIIQLMRDIKLNFRLTEITHLDRRVITDRILKELNWAKYKITEQSEGRILFIKDTVRTNARNVFLTHVDEGMFEIAVSPAGLVIMYTYFIPLIRDIIMFVVALLLAYFFDPVILCIAAMPAFMLFIQILGLKSASKDMMKDIVKVQV